MSLHSDIWFISDTHFGQKNIRSWLKDDGTSARPFASPAEMDEVLIQNWNAKIRPQDKVYHLGDFAYGTKHAAEILPRLNGHKRLIPGNHDDVATEKLHLHFEKILGWRGFKDGPYTILCTHTPQLRATFAKYQLNLHGHCHDSPDIDSSYWNISVERTGYFPVNFDEVMAECHRRGL